MTASSSSATPPYADIVVVAFLCGVLIALCYLMLEISRRWSRYLHRRVTKAVEKRRNNFDNFRKKNGYSWDYVIVFKVFEEGEEISLMQQKFNMKKVLAKIAQGGIETRLCYSVKHTKVFCKLRVPIERLLLEVDILGYTLPTDPEKLKQLCSKGRKDYWEPLRIPDGDVTGQTSMGPYNYAYLPYNYISAETKAELEENGLDAADFLSWRLQLEEVYKVWPSAESRLNQVMGGEAVAGSSTKNPVFAATEKAEQLSATTSLLRGVDRLKLIKLILTSKRVGGCGLDVDLLLKQECFEAVFPLHDLLELRELEIKWLVLFQAPWNQCVDDVKDYFGEKVGLYFGWLGFYTTWLLPAAIVGALFWINVAMTDNNPNAVSIPYFAGFMSLWATLFLEYWKRAEKDYALRWGMIGFENSETDRPAFVGTESISPVTGKPSLYFDQKERDKRIMRSQVVIIGLLLAVIATVGFIFYVRATISAIPSLKDFATILSSLLLAVQIQIMNEIYGTVAVNLTDFENHRTDTEYEDSLIAKTFMFQFVNSYASLFYICFVKPFIPDIDPCVISCMSELQVSLGTIFITRLMLGNLMELGTPFMSSSFKTHELKHQVALQRADNRIVKSNASTSSQSKERRGTAAVSLVGVYEAAATGSGGDGDEDAHDAAPTNPDLHRYEISEVEKAFMLTEYDVMMGTFEDYCEMVIQFGYTTMFVSGFPLATLMALISNYVELRIDAWKLCHLCRRPEPRSQEDIGTWQSVLDVTTSLSIVVNAGIVAFTGSFAFNDTWAVRVWLFMLLASGLLIIKLSLQYYVPDVPVDVEIQLSRHELIKEKVIDNVEDDNDADLLRGIRNIPSMIILSGDDDPL